MHVSIATATIAGDGGQGLQQIGRLALAFGLSSLIELERVLDVSTTDLAAETA